MNARDRLEKLYREVRDVVLVRQHPVTGLLPASTAVNTHGDYTDAWVRDNVYSIQCVWALGMAMRKYGDLERADELEQSTIKLMRGLLQSMMRQAHKVEAFKVSLNPIDALHAKYDTGTGLPVVADDAWGHLQIDATSIFLLMVAQITASGLRIVRTYSEVDFIQNLIYYIGSAYRTPDFGIWERGNKINNGKTEVNASSVGMAKAALQALDGFNLFGKDATSRAVLHTVPDAISQARTVLATLLPRESISKEVDSALLSVIGYPAFAIGDQNMVTRTRDEILSKLGGEYGCKRFLWDGHQTAAEESSRIYYERSELVNFENIESEWPLFFTYLYINAQFNGNKATAKYYREKIESVMIERDGFHLIPELFFVDEADVDAERREPGSRPRKANENLPLVWAQSLYLTGLMLDEGLITKDDLDPLTMRRRSTRYFKRQVALVVLAENDQIKRQLAEAGVIAESVDDIKPVRVMSAPNLVHAYTLVGANAQLGLSGRPARRLQSLATSQTYKFDGREYLCLSWLQSEHDDYRLTDARFVSKLLELEIDHIRRNWVNKEVAVFTFMVSQKLCDSGSAGELYKTLREFQLRTKSDKVGYASANLAFRASRVNNLNLKEACVTPIEAVAMQPKRSLIELFGNRASQKIHDFIEHFGMDDVESYQALKDLVETLGLDELRQRASQLTGKSFLDAVYEQAVKSGLWLTSRYIFVLTERLHNDVSDAVISLNARHMDMTLGDRQVIQHSWSIEKIVDCIADFSRSHIESALLQEALSVIGFISRTQPNLLAGLRTVQLQNILSLCIDSEANELSMFEVIKLGCLAPSELLNRLRDILQIQRRYYDEGVDFDFAKQNMTESRFFNNRDTTPAIYTDWIEWRHTRGLAPRFQEGFLHDIWQSLGHTPRLVFGDSCLQGNAIDSTLTRSSMTPGEESFAQLIDKQVQSLHPAYYRGAIVETLHGYSAFCKAQPSIAFKMDIILGEILDDAAELYVQEHPVTQQKEREIDVLLRQSPHVLQEYVKKRLSQLVASVEATA